MLSTLWTCQHGSFIEPAPPIDANKRVFPPGSSLAWWPHVWGSEASIRIFALAAPKTSIKESVGSTACAPKTSRFAQCLHAAFLPALAKILRVQVNVQLQSFGQSLSKIQLRSFAAVTSSRFAPCLHASILPALAERVLGLTLKDLGLKEFRVTGF